jgi:hypothetical protein
VKPVGIGAVTAAVLGAGLILDELLVPGWEGSCASDPLHCNELQSWDWHFRALVIGTCCAVALVAGALAWFAATQLQKRRRPR